MVKHKETKLKFAEEHMFWREEWEKVIFSNEKRFKFGWPIRDIPIIIVMAKTENKKK